MKILDGKKIANQILIELKNKLDKMKIKPTLAVILIGNDNASKLYVNIKEKTCNKIGIGFRKFELDENIKQSDIIQLIERLNTNTKIKGIVIQLPLPAHLDTNIIINAISPLKDIDGLHTENLGKLLIGESTFVPPAPAAILEIFKSYKISLKEKHIVLVGYGKLVGKPLATMLSLAEKDVTLTICNKFTKNLSSYTKQADILVSATGVAKLIKFDMIKKSSIVIDAGTTKIGGKIVGDVDFDNVKEKVKAITPQTGGIGPITVAKLLENMLLI